MTNNDAPRRNKRFYVYTLSSPDGRVFYIGKGTGNRIDAHEREARRGCRCGKCKAICGVWGSGGEVVRAFVYWTDDEEEAYRQEADLIEQIGLAELSNTLPGGNWRKVSVYNGPKKHILDMTEVEYRTFLRRYFKNKREIDRIVRLWLHRKVAERLDALKDLRRKKNKSDKPRIEKELEDLYMRLGWVNQAEIWLT